MAHKNNKNSKSGKKSNPKTKVEIQNMKIETSNEIGYSKESRKLGKNDERPNPRLMK